MSEDLEARRAALSDEWRRGFDWVERTLGGRITGFERHERWRPAWFIDVERAGETIGVYWRGDRGASDHGVYPLEHEYRVLQVLEDHDIPVPHPYGICDDPHGMLIAKVPGRHDLGSCDDEAEALSVVDHYVELLARMHAIDLETFEAIGMKRPTTAEAIGLGDFESYERRYRSSKCRPEAWIEFAIRWIRRNLPRDRDTPTFLACDCGQFMYDQGRVTAVVDLECAYLGDPAADLAGMRARDLSERLPNLKLAFERYGQYSGRHIDPRVIDYHSVRFGLYSPMVCAHLCARASREIAYVQYLAWYLVYGRCSLQIIAQLEGVEIEALALPDPAPSRLGADHEYTVAMLEPVDGPNSFEIDSTLRAAQLAERIDRYGRELEEQDLDEAAKLLGTRPKSWAESDAALEELVLAAGPERDAEFVQYFTRHILRQEFLLGPAARELEGVSLQPID